MISRDRGYLPHLENEGATYFVTYRLAGALPHSILDDWKSERREIEREAERQGRALSTFEQNRLRELYSKRVEDYLDAGIGECWLKDSAVAEIVAQALQYFDSSRYILHVWCVMPNHVHTVFTLKSIPKSDLASILHTWKSFTANRANKLLNRSGRFWQEEYYDHLIRNDQQFAHYIEYTILNPVKAFLCEQWQHWPWTGVSEQIRQSLLEDKGAG